jgi:hypothetical protein
MDPSDPPIEIDCVYYKIRMTRSQLARDFGITQDALEAGIVHTQRAHAVYTPRTTPRRVGDEATDDEIDWLEWRAMACLSRRFQRARSSFDLIALCASAIADTLFRPPLALA